MSRLDIRIEELVLEGVPAHEAPAVAEALRLELARLLAEDLSPVPGAPGPDAGLLPEGARGLGRPHGAGLFYPGAVDGPAALAAAAARAVRAAVWAALPPAGVSALTAAVEDPARPANPRTGVGAWSGGMRRAAGPRVTTGDATGGVA